MPFASPLPLGTGVYSFVDAARFIGCTARDLRRWMNGYGHKRADGTADFSPPLWANQLAHTQYDGEAIGFRDLIELRFVVAFREVGVPLPLIRRTLAAARAMFSTNYPLTCKKFQTDGKHIFTTVIEESGDDSLVDLVKRQNVIARVIGPSLRSGIEFDENRASLWFPVRNSTAIVFDPNRLFGQPILAQSSVPTVAVAAAVQADSGNESFVAKLFGITRKAVHQAVEFEARMAQRESIH